MEYAVTVAVILPLIAMVGTTEVATDRNATSRGHTRGTCSARAISNGIPWSLPLISADSHGIPWKDPRKITEVPR